MTFATPGTTPWQPLSQSQLAGITWAVSLFWSYTSCAGAAEEKADKELKEALQGAPGYRTRPDTLRPYERQPISAWRAADLFAGASPHALQAALATAAMTVRAIDAEKLLLAPESPPGDQLCLLAITTLQAARGGIHVTIHMHICTASRASPTNQRTALRTHVCGGADLPSTNKACSGSVTVRQARKEAGRLT